jgi:hypothetical protein
MFVENKMPTPQWSLAACTCVSATQGLQQAQRWGCNWAHAGLLLMGIALHRSVPWEEAQRYRRCTSWRASIPGILFTAAPSTHAMVLETPSQHLESQHPSRPSMPFFVNKIQTSFLPVYIGVFKFLNPVRKNGRTN